MSAALLAGLVGVAASFARLAFDAIVQRDAPDANSGPGVRAVLRPKFQMAWVGGGVRQSQSVIPIPRTAASSSCRCSPRSALASYILGWKRIRAGQPLPPTVTARMRAELRRRRRAGTDWDDLPPPDPPPAGSSWAPGLSPARRTSRRASHSPGAPTSAGVGSARADDPQTGQPPPRPRARSRPYEGHAARRLRLRSGERPRRRRGRRRRSRPPGAGGAPLPAIRPPLDMTCPAAWSTVWSTRADDHGHEGVEPQAQALLLGERTAPSRTSDRRTAAAARP